MKNRHHHSSDEKLYWVRDNVFSDHFPTVNAALSEPDGLLAIGGNLTVECLSEAYQSGIFPWFNQDYPILWWSPDPRCVLELNDFKISASLRKTLKTTVHGYFQPRFQQGYCKLCQTQKRQRRHLDHQRYGRRL